MEIGCNNDFTYFLHEPFPNLLGNLKKSERTALPAYVPFMEHKLIVPNKLKL